jgi:uncharacterized protein (TIGR02646 family)
MKYIQKSKTPKELIEHQATPDSTYTSLRKEAIKTALLVEQGDICAYCMQRISKDWDSEIKKAKNEIEHFKSQDEYPKLALNYQNMLGVCNGNTGSQGHLLHCDKSKKEKGISISPLEKRCEIVIHFRKNGKIYSDDIEVEKDVNETLNLNEENLKKNRELAIHQAFQNIKRAHSKKSRTSSKWNIAAIEKEKQEWSKRRNGRFRAYCQAVIYVLNKKINQLSKQ